MISCNNARNLVDAYIEQMELENATLLEKAIERTKNWCDNELSAKIMDLAKRGFTQTHVLIYNMNFKVGGCNYLVDLKNKNKNSTMLIHPATLLQILESNGFKVTSTHFYECKLPVKEYTITWKEQK